MTDDATKLFKQFDQEAGLESRRHGLGDDPSAASDNSGLAQPGDVNIVHRSVRNSDDSSMSNPPDAESMFHQFDREAGIDASDSGQKQGAEPDKSGGPVDKMVSSEMPGMLLRGMFQDESVPGMIIDKAKDIGKTVYEHQKDTIVPRFKRIGAGLRQFLYENGNEDFQPPEGKIDKAIGLGGLDKSIRQFRQKERARNDREATQAQADFAKYSQQINKRNSDIKPNSPEYYANAIVGSTIEMGPAVVATAVTKNPNLGMALMGGQVFGQQYGQSRAQGRTKAEATQDAAFYAAVEALTEKIPLKYITSNGSGKFLKKVFKSSAAEGIQESLGQAFEDAYNLGVLDDPSMMDKDGNVDWGKVAVDMLNAGLIGAGTGGLLAVTHSGLDSVAGSVTKRKTNKAQAEPEISDEELASRIEDDLRQRLSDEQIRQAMETNRQLHGPPAPDSTMYGDSEGNIATGDQNAAQTREAAAQAPPAWAETHPGRAQPTEVTPSEPHLPEALPAPDSTLYGDPEGRVASLDAMTRHQQTLADMGLTPDVMRAQKDREAADDSKYLQEQAQARQSARQYNAPEQPSVEGDSTTNPEIIPEPASGQWADPRLKRPEYRGMLIDAVNYMAEGGGGAGNLTGGDFDVGAENKRVDQLEPVRRQPSVNEKWVQGMLQDHGVSVRQAKAAVAKALRGERLGVRQKRIVTDMLDRQGDEHKNRYVPDAMRELEQARQARRKAKALQELQPSDLRAIHEGMQPSDAVLADMFSGEQYQEDQYPPDMDAEARSLYELTHEAGSIDENATERVILQNESGGMDDAQAARHLWDIINRGQDNGRENAGSGAGVSAGQSAGPATEAPEIQEQRNQGEGKSARGQEAERVNDLLGQDTRQAQALSDEARRRDAARNSGQDSAETGDPGDMFSQAQQQTDLTDEKRHDFATRLATEKRISEMTEPEKDMELAELRRLRITSPLTGLPNKVAFDGDTHLGLNAIGAMDMDGLGWFNKHWGHEAADEVLRYAGQRMQRIQGNGVRLYHRSGDEFALRAKSKAEARRAARKLQKDLASATVKVTAYVDGKRQTRTIHGIGITFGLGESYEEADYHANKSKEDRERSGLRSAKGAVPIGVRQESTPGVSETGRENQDNPTDRQNVADTESQTSPANAGLSVSGPVTDVKQAAALADTAPTDSQKEAGNYKMGHVKLHGLDITIETPAGGKRNPKWPSLHHDYGYIRGTEGKDGDHLDVFLGPDAENPNRPVFVIDQLRPDSGKFDEHKVMLGFRDEAAARKAYLANYESGWERNIGDIVGFDRLSQFKDWMNNASQKRPAAETAEKYQSNESSDRSQARDDNNEPTTKRGAGKKQPSTNGEKIEDFGEVLAGARKHYAAEYRDKVKSSGFDDIAVQPLSKSWPEPNYQKLIGDGMDKHAVAVLRALRDEVGTKPKSAWKLSRWVKATKDLKRRALEILENPEAANAYKRNPWSDASTDPVASKAMLYEAVGHAHSLKNINLRMGLYSLYAGEKFDPPKKVWTIEKYTSARSFPKHLAKGSTAQEAIQNFEEHYDNLNLGSKKERKIQFNIYSRSGEPGYFIGKKLGRNVIELKKFDGLKEARKYLVENQDDLIQRLEEKTDIPNMRRPANSPRVGADHRKGADVTPDQFADTFGFRGVQFGNWVEGGRRQENINETYDALLDMAGILGIPAKSLSLNGELGLAFGARGKGGKNPAAAHYEPDTVVINLTKREGAGSLAHEWFHALDNYFARIRGSEGFVTARPYQSGPSGIGIRPEMSRAFGGVMDAINQSGMTKRAGGLDSRRSKNYWSDPEELAARAYEGYVIAKLQDQSARNDFLSNILDEKTWKAAQDLGIEDGGYPYPTEDEMPAIRAAFDQLFNEIETKETDQGIALFSQAGHGDNADRIVDGFLLNDGDNRPNPLSSETTRQHVDSLTRNWTSMSDHTVRVKVVERTQDLPGHIKSQAPLGDVERTRGVYDSSQNIVWIVSQNMYSKADVERVVFHEILGHYGLRTTLGPGMRPFLHRVYMTYGRNGLADIAQRYGLDLNSKVDREVAAEEKIAQIAEEVHSGSASAKALRLWDSFVELVRKLARRAGFSLDLNRSEIRNMVRNMAGKVKTGRVNPAAAGATMFRFSVGDGPPTIREQPPLWHDGFDVPTDNVIDMVRQKLQDRYIDLRRVQEAVQKSDGVFGDEMDAYMAEEIYHGRTQERIDDARKNLTIEPMLDAMREAGLNIDQLDEYLYARHAAESNARIAEINPEFPQAGSGMSDAEAADILKRYEGNAKVQKLGEMADAITAAHRKLLVSEGLETPEAVAAWERTYKHYVPLKGRAHQDGVVQSLLNRGRGFDVRGKTKRRYGRRSRATNIFSNLVAQYETDIVRAEKAKVGRALLRLVQANPNPDLWEVNTEDFQPQINPKTGLVEYRRSQRYKLADNVLAVKVDGIEHHIELKGNRGERLARALKNMGAADAGGLVRGMASVNRFLAAVNTGYNPEFIISNLIRDLQTAGINLQGTDASDATGRILMDVGHAWRGIRQEQKGKAGGEWAQYFREFKKVGGKTGWIDAYNDVDRLQKSLIKEINHHNRHPANIKRLARGVADFVEAENIAIENATRLSAFVHARRMGLSEAKAASLAKNLTINFNRRGEWGVTANALYLFYNASIQGSVRLVQAMKSPRVRKVVAGIVVANAILDLINRLISDRDKESGKSYYDMIPSYIKERNMVIMLGGKSYLKIPLPYGYNVFANLGRVAGGGIAQAAGVTHDWKITDGMSDVAASVIGSFNPVGSDSTLAQFVSPTIFDPVVEIGENTDWAGRNIFPESNPFDRAPAPDSQRYWGSTTEVSKTVADTLNTLTGGNKVRPGFIDVSPATMDYLGEFVTGGVGRFVNNTIDTPAKLLSGEPVDSYRIPFVRKLYGTVSDREVMDDFYENLRDIGYAEKEMDWARENHDREMLLQKREANRPYLQMRSYAKVVNKQLHALRARRDKIKAMDLPIREKEKRLTRIEDRMGQLMSRFNGKLREKTKKAD